MQRLHALAAAAGLLLHLAAGAGGAPPSCPAGGDGSACAASPKQKVAEALTAERLASPEEAPLELLQRSAAGVARLDRVPQAAGASASSASNASAATNASAASNASIASNATAASNASTASNSTAASARAGATPAQGGHAALNLAALEKALREVEAARGNRSGAAGQAKYTRGKDCSPYTGGMCFITNQCAESRSAECSPGGMCVCPDYTCNENGKCVLSPSEIANAMKNGVAGVAEKVTSVASIVPGIADTVGGLTGSLSGISDTVTGILGSLTGSDKDYCSSRYMGTCFFSGCDESLGYTVSCEYGSCQCKAGFCKSGSGCVVDAANIAATWWGGR